MSSPPKAVIHINFMPEGLVFDARPIWKALIDAAKTNKTSALRYQQLSEEFGGMALHIGTRSLIMEAAIRELKAGIQTISGLVPDAMKIDDIPNTRLLRAAGVEQIRDRALLAIDSF